MPRLDFDEASHSYALDGQRVPGVTRVLEPFTGLEYVDRATLRAAQELGTNVHKAIHLHNTGRLASCPVEIEPYLAGWIAFLEESGAVVIASELPVYSERYKYAGTLDDLLHWRSGECLVDVKSGSVVPKTVGPQTAAYRQAYNEMHRAKVRRRYCVHLTGDGRYRTHKLTDERDWNVFQSALNAHRYFNGGR